MVNEQRLISVENENGRYCYVPLTYKVTLGEIVDLLQQFKQQPETLVVSNIPNNSFAKKSTAYTYLICRQINSNSRSR